MDESFLPEEQQNIEVIEKEKIRISVRNLVEFVFRSGDIDNRVGKGVQKEAMQQGSRMHRKIQKRMGAEYRSEVALKHEMIMGHYLLSVEGRADGIFWRYQSSGELESKEEANAEELLTPDSGESEQKIPAGEISVPDFGEAAEVSSEQVYFIDEIKCMYTDVTRFETPFQVHMAQAKCYAYIFALQNGLTRMGIQITYCDLDTEEIQRFEEMYSFE